MNKVLMAFALLIFSKSAQALCVVSDVANLRSGPGTQYKITWTVGKYTPLLKVGQKRSWYKVADQDGKRHWISSGLVSLRFKCLAIKTRHANLRSGPGSQYSLTAYERADRYTPFKRITNKGEWYHVTDPSGNKFWVHNSNVWRPLRISNVSF